MTTRRTSSILPLCLALIFCLMADDVLARGGGGRRGGGGARRGNGTTNRGTTARPRNNNRNDNKQEQEEERKAERAARVAEARLLYAKRERQEMWDAESRERIEQAVQRILQGASG